MPSPRLHLYLHWSSKFKVIVLSLTPDATHMQALLLQEISVQTASETLRSLAETAPSRDREAGQVGWSHRQEVAQGDPPQAVLPSVSYKLTEMGLSPTGLSLQWLLCRSGYFV